MGLAFLTPLFFVGALALAIPILIHLTHREKREIVEFPSLMFLQKIPYRSVRRQKIRQWLLFLLRCAALLAIIAAFARPYWERIGAAAGAISGAREVVILVDRSYSMGYGDRWERALEAAQNAIATVSPEDRATLVAFSDRSEALNQPTSDRGELNRALAAVELGSGTTRYGPALQLAKKLLEQSKLPLREVLLITDFQKIGWQGEAEIQLPEGTVVTPIVLSDPDTSNVSVTTVILEREYLADRERVVVSARLTNKGIVPYEGSRVWLEVGGRRLQDKPVSFEPNSSVTVTFDPFTLPEGISRGTVRLEDDALPQDNQFNFVLWPGQSLSVLILEGGGRRAQRSLYLTRSLDIGDRPSFDVAVSKLSNFRKADLRGRSVVLLNDTAAPGAQAGGQLKEFVSNGGGLVIVLGEGSDPSGWGEALAELLPARWGAPTDRSTDWGGTLSYIDYSHPVFEIFSAPHSGDFSPARFFRYRPMDAVLDRGVLARFDDGAVALAEKAFGKGKVLVWSSTLDTFWNDLALQPVFLPFVHQLAKYAADYSEAESWQTVGDLVDLARYLEHAGIQVQEPATLGGPELVALTPSGEKSYLSSQKGLNLLALDQQGFYDLRSVGASSQFGEPLSLAVNLDLTESDLSSLDPEELIAAISFRQGDVSVVAGANLTPEDHERRQNFWWYLLLGAFLLLMVETAFSNRLSRAAR